MSPWIPNTVISRAGTADLGYYNVKSYGAIGDGSHDDRGAIQSALDAVPNPGGGGGAGGAVFFPPGKYRISSGLTSSTPNIALIGSGAGLGAASILGLGATQIVLDNSAFVGFTFNPSGVLQDQAPVIRDLTFVGSASATGAIRIRNANNFHLDSVGIVDFPAGYGFLTECSSSGGNQYGQYLTPHIHSCLTGIKLINSNGLRVIGGSIEGTYSDTTVPTGSRGIWASGSGSDTLCVLGTVLQAIDTLVDIEGGSAHMFIGIRGELLKTMGYNLASSFGSQIMGGTLVNSDSLSGTGTGIAIASSCSSTKLDPLPLMSSLGTNISDSDDSTIYETRLYKTAGDPGGVVTGDPGDLCIRTSGGPPWYYFKETGTGTNTGWVSRQA